MTELAPHLLGKLLHVGCGTKPYQALFNVSEYVRLDIDSDAARKCVVADKFYNGIKLCNQVLEHVFNPEEFVAELNRVLRPSGKLVLTVPFVWDEHGQPYDYAICSSFGLRASPEKHGFKIMRHLKLAADASIIFQIC